MKKLLKNKLILPDIDENDFPYKFYKCWWSDIFAVTVLGPLKHIKKSKPAICITMGWLIQTSIKNLFLLETSTLMMMEQ